MVNSCLLLVGMENWCILVSSSTSACIKNGSLYLHSNIFRRIFNYGTIIVRATELLKFDVVIYWFIPIFNLRMKLFAPFKIGTVLCFVCSEQLEQFGSSHIKLIEVPKKKKKLTEHCMLNIKHLFASVVNICMFIKSPHLCWPFNFALHVHH